MMPGWDDLSEALATARAEMRALSPDEATAEEGDAYLMRVLTSSLADGFIGHILTEGGLATAFPTRGGSNPDYRMLAAGIDPSRGYRLEGQLKASERVAIGLYSIRPDGAVLLAGYAEITAANAKPDGSFAIDLAAGAEGAGTLAIEPDVRQIIIRTLHRSTGAPAHVVLSGGDPLGDLALATGTTAGALGHIGQGVLRIIRQFLVWTRTTSSRPNWLGEPPAELGQTVLGTPDVRYCLGYYALEPGEWLEVTMPKWLTGYWNLQAQNHWLETLPGANANDRTAQPDIDGHIRIGIGPDLPAGVANRIDTRGRRRGVIVCRLPAEQNLPYPQARLRKGDD